VSAPALWDWLYEALEPLGVVRIRRMFGGAGVSIDGYNIGFAGDDALYLKVDAETLPAFEAEGLEPFIYTKAGVPVAMSYRRAPDAVFDDAGEMQHWGGMALAAAMRAKAPKPRRAKRNNSGV
jgi:DNA transformation protein